MKIGVLEIKGELVAQFKITCSLRPCEKCGLSPVQTGLDKLTGKWFRFECPECGVNWRGQLAPLPHWWLSRQLAADNWNEINQNRPLTEPKQENPLVTWR